MLLLLNPDNTRMTASAVPSQIGQQYARNRVQMDAELARQRLAQKRDARRTTFTFHVGYAGYDSRLVVRLSDDGRPTEVMFFIDRYWPNMQRQVETLQRNCQLISVALRHGTPLKDLTAVYIRPYPLEIAVHRMYGDTPAPVANDDTEWVLRHLALVYLSQEDCVEIGVHPGFWCPSCDQAVARPVGQSFFCDCGWSYIN